MPKVAKINQSDFEGPYSNDEYNRFYLILPPTTPPQFHNVSMGQSASEPHITYFPTSKCLSSSIKCPFVPSKCFSGLVLLSPYARYQAWECETCE